MGEETSDCVRSLFLGDGDSVKVTQLDEELGMLDWRSQVRLSLSTPCWRTVSAGGQLHWRNRRRATDERQSDQAATALAATLGADLILLSTSAAFSTAKGNVLPK